MEIYLYSQDNRIKFSIESIKNLLWATGRKDLTSSTTYGRRSAEPGQDVFADYELYLEEEKSSEENGDGIRHCTLEPQLSTHRHRWRIRRNWAVGLKSGSLQNFSRRLIY